MSSNYSLNTQPARASGPVPWAFQQLNNRTAVPQSVNPYMTTGVQAAYRTPSAANVLSDPGIAAGMAAFNANAKPQIENEAALAGLGTSTGLTKNLSDAYAQMLPTLTEGAMGRNEAAVERGSNAIQALLGREQSGAQQEASALLQSSPQLQAMSQNLQGNRAATEQQLSGAGSTIRGIQQTEANNQYNDLLRRQGLSEQALMLPFGQTMPGAFGSKVSTSK